MATSQMRSLEEKSRIYETDADMVLGTDLGCLMNIAGKLKRQGSNIEVRHVAEILADMHDHPAIASPDCTGTHDGTTNPTIQRSTPGRL